MYYVAQVDPDKPDIDEGLQKIFVGVGNPGGHFYIGDTKISAKYIKPKE